MRRRLSENTGWTVLAAAGMAIMAWLGLREFAFTDYDNEARPAVEALVHGHFGAFLTLAPVYGGSLLERAPFALATDLWGGGELAVYRMMALPCLLAGGALGLWLIAWMRRNGVGRPAQAVALVLCVANPIALLSLEIGHPDELLGGVLCVAAVLLAARDRGIWAGIALGAAIANKEWAVLAIGPVLLALPRGRVRCLAIAGGLAGALLAPFAFDASGFVAQLHTAATSTGTAGAAGTSFQPWQVWWFFGAPTHAGMNALGAIPVGARAAPGWVESISRQLIVGLAAPLTLGAWLSLRRRSPGARSEHVALALLALLALERCMLDPWDNIYYPLPFILALLAWEALARGRVPLLALASTLAIWSDHGPLGALLSPDGQALVFIAWTVPLALWLASVLYAPGALARLLNRCELLGQARQPLMAALGDDREILDAHAEATG